MCRNLFERTGHTTVSQTHTAIWHARRRCAQLRLTAHRDTPHAAPTTRFSPRVATPRHSSPRNLSTIGLSCWKAG
eukprot:6568601-Prymnesium_polylepis.1